MIVFTFQTLFFNDGDFVQIDTVLFYLLSNVWNDFTPTKEML